MAGPTRNFKDELADEVATILASDFSINVTETKSVPHFGDPAITFPNLDSKSQGCKLIDTCVLYVDIRRSTQLNLSHRATTVAKLYSAFVRTMTRCARERGGHVRGIIGDRVMVIFDSQNAFVNAVETAISMNSTAQFVINKHFRANEVTCGIGIDAGKMLATKTGFRRHGYEQQNYRNLVWLGRPANVASKLTDIANKPEESVNVPSTQVIRLSNALWGNVVWQEESWPNVLRGFRYSLLGGWSHVDQDLAALSVVDKKVVVRPATPPILMTKAVYDGYKSADPQARSIVNNWFSVVHIDVPGYDKQIYGGDVYWDTFR